MSKLYKWQNIIILIIAILTFISITVRDFNNINELTLSFSIGFLFDLAIGIGINIFVLWLIFQFGNLVYRKVKKDPKKISAYILIPLTLVGSSYFSKDYLEKRKENPDINLIQHQTEQYRNVGSGLVTTFAVRQTKHLIYYNSL